VVREQQEPVRFERANGETFFAHQLAHLGVLERRDDLPGAGHSVVVGEVQGVPAGPVIAFYTLLYNRTRSVLLCVLLHGAFTPSLDHLVLVDDNLTVDLVILATLVAAAAVLVTVTRGRLGFGHRPSGGPSRVPGEALNEESRQR
jgi:hypothetical protein